MAPASLLFHITTCREWSAAREAGVYAAPSLESEGFIHLSFEHQWQKTANRFYRDTPNLVLLAVVAGRLGAEVRFEAADGDEFPHLYGPLLVSAVEAVFELARAAGGEVLEPKNFSSVIEPLR
jgi:uncharacterized protein (DUF952 family)